MTHRGIERDEQLVEIEIDAEEEEARHAEQCADQGAPQEPKWVLSHEQTIFVEYLKSSRVSMVFNT